MFGNEKHRKSDNLTFRASALSGEDLYNNNNNNNVHFYSAYSLNYALSALQSLISLISNNYNT